MSRATWTLVAAVTLGLATQCPVALADDPPPPPTIPYLGVADLNGDVALDGLDFGLFCADWMAFQAGGAANARSDFDSNNAIDRLDAVKFLDEWLKVQVFAAQAAGTAAQ